MNTSFTKRAAVAVGAIALALLGSVAVAAPASAAPGNVDSAAGVSLTIHKHEQTSTAATTGTGKSGQTVAGNPIGGVTFSIEKMNGTDLTTSTGWDQAKTYQSMNIDTLIANTGNRTKLADITTASSGANLGIASISTAANAGLTKSLYLVTETSAPGNVATKAKPFLVTLPYANNDSTWNYDVHVYPKNGVSSLSKAYVANDASYGDNRNFSKWNISVGIPYLSQGTTAFSSFVVADTIDTRYLEFVQNGSAYVTALTITGPGTGATATTVPVANYDIRVGNVGSATNTAALEAAFKGAGFDQLKAAQGGTVTFTVTTRTKLVPTDGVIKNLAGSNINGNVNGTINGTTGPEGEKSATTKFADLIVYTHTNGANLGGAVYALLDANGAPVKVNGVALTATADANTGMLTFPNLPVGDAGTNYQVQIVTAPAGYDKPATDKVTVNVTAGTPVVPNDKTTTVGSKDYAPFAFTQTAAWALPLTGGDGGVSFLLAGGGIVVVAVGAMLMIATRRKGKAQTA